MVIVWMASPRTMRLAVRGGRSSRGSYRSRGNLVVALEVKRGRLVNTYPKNLTDWCLGVPRGA
jgi:hypothetical protein